MSITLIRVNGLSPWLLAALLSSPAVMALDDAAEPHIANNSQAFWRWFDEYADEQGEVLDPADYGLINSQQQALNTASLPKLEVIVNDDTEKEPKP